MIVQSFWSCGTNVFASTPSRSIDSDDIINIFRSVTTTLSHYDNIFVCIWESGGKALDFHHVVVLVAHLFFAAKNLVLENPASWELFIQRIQQFIVVEEIGMIDGNRFHVWTVPTSLNYFIERN